MKLLKIFFFLTLVSCSAMHVNKPTIPKYAPKGYKAKGVVKYLAQGADFIINKRREDAFEKMHTVCKGNYKITGEGDKMEGGMISAVGNNLMMSSSQYWYISYSCE
jgi:hypothetical protein